MLLHASALSPRDPLFAAGVQYDQARLVQHSFFWCYFLCHCYFFFCFISFFYYSWPSFVFPERICVPQFFVFFPHSFSSCSWLTSWLPLSWPMFLEIDHSLSPSLLYTGCSSPAMQSRRESLLGLENHLFHKRWLYFLIWCSPS